MFHYQADNLSVWYLSWISSCYLINIVNIEILLQKLRNAPLDIPPVRYVYTQTWRTTLKCVYLRMWSVFFLHWWKLLMGKLPPTRWAGPRWRQGRTTKGRFGACPLTVVSLSDGEGETLKEFTREEKVEVHTEDRDGLVSAGAGSGAFVLLSCCR